MVKPAFSDPVFSAQSSFRAILDALTRPGEVKDLNPTVDVPLPLTPAMAAIALTLLDHDTPVWLDAPLAASPEVSAWIRFHTGAPIAILPDQSAFAFVREQMRLPKFSSFNPGTAEYPDRSTTVVIHVDSWNSGPVLHLTGPGIKRERRFAPGPLPSDMAERLRANRALFPRGIDLLLVTEGSLAALPRSVRPVIYES